LALAVRPPSVLPMTRPTPTRTSTQIRSAALRSMPALTPAEVQIGPSWI
jgi:hypothetical protein